MTRGALVISLDFELFWGLRDCVPLDNYRANLLGVRRAIPALLAIFRERKIRATWATVGLLFCRDQREIKDAFPHRLPRYADERLSPYGLAGLGKDEADDPFHYGASLVREIHETAGQEVASHTFSHFYCLEPGQTAEDFDADLKSAKIAAARLDIELSSLVFPRNQENREYRGVVRRNGFTAIRSAAPGWAYRSSAMGEPRIKRALRLLDTYVPLGGRSFLAPRPDETGLVAVPASAFLRPYSTLLAPLDGLLLRRLAREMTSAAENGEMFHLWWHPHNFGVNLRENLDRLGKLLDHFATLAGSHGMASLSMKDVADRAVK
jgi:peptidoglycan/xylan/chitin deacetylase (PgdA/CDA1 family)